MDREWIYDVTGDKIPVNHDSRTVFMPYSVEVEDYPQCVKDLMSRGWVVQVEII